MKQHVRAMATPAKDKASRRRAAGEREVVYYRGIRIAARRAAFATVAPDPRWPPRPARSDP